MASPVLTVELAKLLLPLDRQVQLGGKIYHSHWLGGVGANFRFTNARYGLRADAWENAPTGEPIQYYISAPTSAVTINTFAASLVANRWKFYSANALDEMSSYPTSHPTFGWSYADLAAPHPADTGNLLYETPALQHFVFADMTGTTRSNITAGSTDDYPFMPMTNPYALYHASEASVLATDLARDMGPSSQDVVVVAVDGSGSFGSGTGASQYIDDFIAGFSAAKPGNNTTLIVTKFSDYPENAEGFFYGGSTFDIPSLLCGTWTGINPSITSAVVSVMTDLAHRTGNGGDTNESQIEGMWEGMKAAGTRAGKKAMVVYTDAASVVAWEEPRVGVINGELIGSDRNFWRAT